LKDLNLFIPYTVNRAIDWNTTEAHDLIETLLWVVAPTEKR
jgi:hypothetical protein